MKRLSAMRRQAERELIVGLAPRRRRALIERLRGNVEQRRGWDRAIAALRVLERRVFCRFEMVLVERWLFVDLGELGVVAAARPLWRWAWLGGVALKIASAAAVLLWIDGVAGE
jgi:hypothetical protein